MGWTKQKASWWVGAEGGQLRGIQEAEKQSSGKPGLWSDSLTLI